MWIVEINLRTYEFTGYMEARRFAIYWDVEFPKWYSFPVEFGSLNVNL